MAPIEALDGLDHRKFLYLYLYPRLSSNTGGIDKEVFPFAIAEKGVNSITGSPRQFAHHQAVLFENSIDQG